MLGYKERRIAKSRIANRKYRGIPQDLPVRKYDGKGYVNQQGYRMLGRSKHPNANKARCVPEHVFVMSQYLKRPIRKGETVHHINGIKTDNRIENLELWHKSHPSGQRLEEKIIWAKELLSEYGYTVLEPKAQWEVTEMNTLAQEP